MADDVQPITGTTARVAARLCNFRTGQAALLPSHAAWLEANVKPALAGVPAPWVDLWGYASRLGNPVSNQALSTKRCEAVRLAVKPYSPTVTFPQEFGKGESESGGGADNDDGYWRAVEIYVYGAKPAVRPRPPRPRPPDPGKHLRDLLLLVSNFLQNLASNLPFGGAILAKTGIKLPTTLRPLNPQEQAEAATVFAASLDFSHIFISDGLGGGGRPFTLAVHDASLGWAVILNMGDAATWHTRPRSNTLVHELTHAWQSQHHPDRTAYMVNSVKSQALAEFETRKGRLFGSAVTVDSYYYVPGKPFGTYGAEQVAEQVEDVYRGKTPASRPVVLHVASLAPYAASPGNVAGLATARAERDDTPGCVT